MITSVTLPNRATQQRLPLGKAPSLTRRDFIVSPANAEAVEALDAWPAWPGSQLALIGPEGSGKSHLARIWSDRAAATIIDRGHVDLSLAAGKAVLVEDADRRLADETLFHLINMADSGTSLLLTGRTPPLQWATDLPDLRSRLNALMVASLRPPDDVVLEGVLVKLFEERNIRPGRDLTAYLLRRIERSVPAMQDVVARIDDRAGAEGREITRPLAREVLKEFGYGSETL
jgi:chromosomal replication initiation ATPase DnaA